MKKIFITTLLFIHIIVLNIISPLALETSDEDLPKKIDGFRGYSWGTSFDVIKENEITDDMIENFDYLIIEDYGEEFSDPEIKDVSMISLLNSSVGGYEASSTFYFYEDELIIGKYDAQPDISVKRDERREIHQELVLKYTVVYGVPTVEKPSSGWGPFALWVDSDKNFVFINGTLQIYYSNIDSPYISLFCSFDKVEEYHQVNIEDEVSKADNKTTDGI